VTNSKKIVAVSFLLVGCMGRSTPTPTPSPSSPNVAGSMAGNIASFSFDVHAPAQKMTIGDSQALSATTTDAGTILNVTMDASWSSSDATIAAVDAQGKVSAIAAGSVAIHATLMDRDASVVLTIEAAAVAPPVTLQSLRLDGPASLALGATGHYSATAVYSDGSTMDVTGQATWSTRDPNIAAAGNNPGDVQAAAAGATDVVADFASVEGTAALTVTIATLSSIAVTGGVDGPYLIPQQLAAIGTYSDGSTQDLTATAVFSTSDATVATMDGSTAGQLDGVGPGSVTITAAVDNVSGSATVTLNNAQRTGIVTDNDTNTILPAGTCKWINTYYQYEDGSLQFTGAGANWTSSDDNIATVGNGADLVGLTCGVSAGTAILTVSAGGYTITTPVIVKSM
jgi:hypothetical protein